MKFVLLFIFYWLLSSPVNAQTLPELSFPKIVKQIKPSVVAVGTIQQTRRPPSKILATGFVVADGYHVITNYHVLPKLVDAEKKEFLVIFFRQDNKIQYRKVRVLLDDKEHDLALLRIEGTRLPTVKIKQHELNEGESIAFTGYPIGAVLGLYPVTHKGIVSAISPVAIPAPSSEQLSVKMIKRLRNPYLVYQLDATAYPGNSGSPMYDTLTGDVLGIINKVFIKESKEAVLQKPSGITYAIPAKYALQLLKKAKIL